MDDCRAGIDAAARGEFRIAVSTLAVAEVLRLRSKEPISPEEASKVRAFFESEAVVMVALTPEIAFSAQQVVWEHAIDPKDAVHVATALYVHEMETGARLVTFDGSLVGKDGLLLAPGKTVPLTITRPDYQLLLPTA